MVRKISVINKKSYFRSKEIYLWESTVVMASYLVQYDTLLQTEHVSLQNVTAISLQNATVVLQNVVVITKYDLFC